jgi:glycosyltransferase involved in cell wall biosynthesis
VLGLLEGFTQGEHRDELITYLPRGISVAAEGMFSDLSRIESQAVGASISRATLASRHPVSRLIWELPRRLARDEPDVAQFQYIGPLWSPCPVAIAVHDVSFCLDPGMLGWKTSSRMRLTTRTAIRRAKIVLTPSKWSAQMVTRFYPEAASKIRTVPLGVSAQFSAEAKAADEELRSRARLPASYFLYVGRRQRRKNVEGLLASYEKALSSEPDLPPLVLVGPSGEGGDVLARAGANEALRDRTLALHDMPDSCLPAIYRGARGLLFPCRYEGFGLPVLEAMACGCPVIVAAEGGLPELVQEAGIKVDPYDSSAWARAIVALNSDAPRRAEMAELGTERARHYTWRATAESTRAAYETALAS